MKFLNEKTVANLPLTQKCDKEGWMYKRGMEYNTSFKRRYFVLLCNMLYYYEKQGDKEPIGVIILERHTVELYDDSEKPNSFVIRYPEENMRHFVLCPENPKELNSWIRAIASADIDYTRLTLEELEAQQQRDTFEIPEMPEVTPLRSSIIGAEGGPPRENPFSNEDAADSSFRVTVHFPTFQHFHEAIEHALCPETPEDEAEKSVVAPESENLIEL